MRVLRRIAIGSVVPALIIAFYWIFTTANPSPFFPPPPVIAARFAELFLFDRVPTDVLPSLANFVVGYIIAAVVGVVLGIVIGRIRWLRSFAAPVLDFGRSIPAIMLIPPLVLVLGVGDVSKIAIIALGAFFPIVLSALDGLRRTDPALLDVTRALRLSRFKEVLVAWIPSAAPSIAGGMQTGLQFALVLMVASEMFAAYRGLGYLTMRAQQTFDSASVWAGIVLLAIIGFVINLIFVVVRDRVLAWHVGLRAASRSR